MPKKTVEATAAQGCRGCGCTEDRACVTGGVPCHWAEPGLCSACANGSNGSGASGLAVFENIDIGLISESPTNPRKTFKGIEELAADLKFHGMLQPVLVRPAPVNGKAGEMPRYQIVCGSRRLRAARIAGLTSLPAVIRTIADDKALELMIIENSQREDVHPLEEAEGYEALHKKHGYSADDIAAKVGKSKSWVYQRMKLLALCPKARQAFMQEKILPSVAILVARIPSPKLQEEALRSVVGDKWHGPMSHERAQQLIVERYMLRLTEAPFDRADAELLPGAGPCTTCPKRTGNQAELFADIKSADICTEPTCYQKKVAAWGERRLEELKASGAQVLPPSVTKNMFHPHDDSISPGTAYIDLDSKCYEDPKYRIYRKLIGDQEPPIVVALHPKSGKVFELVAAKDARQAMKKAGVNMQDRAGSRMSSVSPQAKAKAAFEARRSALVIAQMVEVAETSQISAQFWQVITSAVVSSSWSDVCRSIVARRKLVPKVKSKFGAGHADTVRQALKDMNANQARGLLVEAVATRFVGAYDWEGGGNPIKALCDLFGINRAKCAAKAKAELAAKTTKAAKKAKEPARRGKRE